MSRLPWFNIGVYAILAIGLGWLAFARILPAAETGLMTKVLVLGFMGGVLLAGFLSMMSQWRERGQ